MNDVFMPVVTALNGVANALGRLILAPIAVLPGWLSATLVGVASGVLMLLAFKYTSNQTAIRQVRNHLKADLLAMSLFKGEPRVWLRSQRGVLANALRLVALAVVPMLVMVIPVGLLLGQMSLWYPMRPLRVGEESVVTLELNESSDADGLHVALEPSPAVDATLGPVRIQSQNRICWNVRAREEGAHFLAFNVGNQTVRKTIHVGKEFQRISPRRPEWTWSAALRYPDEPPFPGNSSVRSIAVDYPARSSWTCGSDSWIAWWFLTSLLGAACFRPVLRVNL